MLLLLLARAAVAAAADPVEHLLCQLVSTGWCAGRELLMLLLLLWLPPGCPWGLAVVDSTGPFSKGELEGLDNCGVGVLAVHPDDSVCSRSVEW